MCKSDGGAGGPLRFASMTRRHASMVASSPRSFAASRAAQAASEGLSYVSLSDVSLSDLVLSDLVPSDLGLSDLALSDLAPSDLGSSEIIPRRSPAAAPNWIAFMVNVPQPISMHVMRSQAVRTGFSTRGIFACLIEFQNASGCVDVEAGKLVFQVGQVQRGDAVIFCAEKQQCHGRRPRKVEGFGQNQQHLSVLAQQGAFNHIAGQGA